MNVCNILGGEIVSTFDSPETVKYGSCELIEQVTIGEDTLLRFSGVPLGNACSIVLRGSTQQILDEAERSLHDALCVLTTHVKQAKTVPGAGASEMLMSTAIAQASQKVRRLIVIDGHKQSVFDAFKNVIIGAYIYFNIIFLYNSYFIRCLERSPFLWRHSLGR